MEPRLLERDPLSGVEKWFEWDNLEEKAAVRLRGPIEAGLDHAQRLRNIPGYQDLSQDMVHHSHITPMLQLKLYHEHGLDLGDPDHLPYIMHKVETDPDYAKARVGAYRFMSKEHTSRIYFGARRKRTRHYGCELTKILDRCK